MIKMFCIFELLLIISCKFYSDTPRDAATMIGASSCLNKLDTADFGQGYSHFNKDLLCLDTVFTYDRFKSDSIRLYDNDIEIQNNKISIKWSYGSISLKIDSNELSYLNDINFTNISSTKMYVPEASYVLYFKNKAYLIVALLQYSVSSTNPNYSFLVFNKNNLLIRFIDNFDQMSPFPNCFCDINNDGELDYLQVDRTNKKLRFISVSDWAYLSQYDLPIRQIMDNIWSLQ